MKYNTRINIFLKFLNVCKACKWHILAWIVVFITTYHNQTRPICYYGMYTFKWWWELLDQVGGICFVCSVTIGLLQCTKWSVKQGLRGKKIPGNVMTIFFLLCFAGWGLLYVSLMAFGAGGGFIGLVMMNLPFAIPLYYIVRSNVKNMSVVLVASYIIALIYTYCTIELKGPLEFMTADTLINVPRTWFYCYPFYRWGTIFSRAFFYCSTFTILVYVFTLNIPNVIRQTWIGIRQR